MHWSIRMQWSLACMEAMKRDRPWDGENEGDGKYALWKSGYWMIYTVFVWCFEANQCYYYHLLVAYIAKCVCVYPINSHNFPPRLCWWFLCCFLLLFGHLLLAIGTNRRKKSVQIEPSFPDLQLIVVLRRVDRYHKQHTFNIFRHASTIQIMIMINDLTKQINTEIEYKKRSIFYSQ